MASFWWPLFYYFYTHWVKYYVLIKKINFLLLLMLWKVFIGLLNFILVAESYKTKKDWRVQYYDVTSRKPYSCYYTPLYENKQKWARNKSMETTWSCHEFKFCSCPKSPTFLKETSHPKIFVLMYILPRFIGEPTAPGGFYVPLNLLVTNKQGLNCLGKVVCVCKVYKMENSSKISFKIKCLKIESRCISLNAKVVFIID